MDRRTTYFVLFSGVIAVSFAAIFIRWAEAPASVIAFYRMGLASIVWFPLVWLRHRSEFQALSRRQAVWLMAGGTCLALHFLLWIQSMDYTSVASSVFFVTTQPIFVAAASIWLLREPVTRRLAAGIVLSLAGTVIIGVGDFSPGETQFFGNLLGIGGAVMAAGYLLIGRLLRQTLSLQLYAGCVYGISAAILLAFVLITMQPLTGFTHFTWLNLLLLALVPTLIGHTSFNWVLKYLPPAVVSVAILGEPIGATFLAYWLLNEPPGFHTLSGGLLIISGIYLAVTHRRAGKRPRPD